MDTQRLAALAALCAHPWAMLESAWSELETMCGDPTVPDKAAAIPAKREPSPRGAGVAVVPIYGTIFPKPNVFTHFGMGTAVSDIRQQFRSALASKANTIVFDVDSPGGSVALVDELSAEIYSARNTKETIAVVNPMMASAAYNLGSAANKIVVTQSGVLGSIGVFAQHVDVSEAEEQSGIKTTLISAGKYKTEGNPFEPLTTDARAAIQEDVDAYYADFVSSVARNRGVSRRTVKNGFGQGRVVRAEVAIAEGMADSVGTFNEVLESLGVAVPTLSLNARTAVLNKYKAEILRRRIGGNA